MGRARLKKPKLIILYSYGIELDKDNTAWKVKKDSEELKRGSD